MYLLLLTVSALLVDGKREYEKDSRFYRRLLYSATDLCVWLLRIRVHISGKEKLPEGFRRITEIREQLLNGNYILDADYVEAKSLATVAYIILKEVL